MPDYRRIVSYLYYYENREKKDCKGFIKAEQRNGALKLTIQIQDDHLMEGMKLNLCFYQKEEAHWRVWKLDWLSIGAGQEETVLSYNKESLPEQFDIQNQYGVVLYCKDTHYYGSVWIGEDIPIDQLSAKQLSGDSSVEDTQTERSSDTEEKELKAERSGDTEGKEQQTERSGDTEEKELKTERSSDTEGKESQVNAVRQDKEQAGSELKMTEKDAGDSESEATLPGTILDLLEPIRGQAPAAEKIFNSAFHEGYQVSPVQLMQLGEEADLLSENQFLLKGYGRYHHLLAGKVRYDGADRYCVGVPGVYENREKYMAQLYQFPVFLSLTENRVKTGRFGYWLHILS